MSFWRQISPRRAVLDFAAEWRQPTPRRWQIMGVSIAATTGLMIFFLPENQRIEPRPPQVTWITSFAPDRTEEEIVASNIANQQRQDELRAMEQEREEFRRDFYRSLGRATGLDVDAMEREIERERAAEAAAAERNRDEAARAATRGE